MVGVQVAPLGESRDAQSPPGPGGDQPAFRRIHPGQRAFGVQPGGAGVRPHGQDRRGDRVSGRGHHSHLGWLSQIGGFGRRFQRLVPASGVHVQPCPARSARRRWRPACPVPGSGPWRPAAARTAMRGFVEQPGGGADSPQSRLVHRGAGDPPQVRDELSAAAVRVGAGQYPQFPRVGTAHSSHGRGAAAGRGLPAGAGRGARPGGGRGCLPGRRRSPRPPAPPRPAAGRSAAASSATEISVANAAERRPA